MGFLERPYKPLQGRLLKGQSIQNPPDILRAEASVYEQEDFNPDVTYNQERLYAKLTWFQSAVSSIADMASTTPLGIYLEEQDEDQKAVPNHAFEQLLRRPNPMQSRTEYLNAVFSYFKSTGNSYTWMNRANEKAPPSELWTIPSHQIRPVPDKQMYLLGYKYDPGNGQELLLEPWEIMHFKSFNPFNHYVGLSPVEAVAVVAEADMAAQKYNKNFYAVDNAKFPGILTFADTMDKAEWDRLKEQLKDQHGGVRRSLMMLQGTGTGDVRWLQTAMSQADMEYLKGRQFNKEEVYELVAKGLGSWLAINSTEANSVTGREAFFELAVFPAHVGLAEKITNDILPVYGNNLVARFEDVRTVDTINTLKEQEAYERSHTVAEVRKKYYGDDPIKEGDVERNTLTTLELSGRKKPSDLQSFGDTAQMKAKETAQFKAFVKGRMKEGCYNEIDNFEFHYLDEAEQLALKAEIKPSPEMLFTQLREVIQEEFA